MKTDRLFFKLCFFSSIIILSLCQSPVALNAITTGSIYLATNDLYNAPSAIAYTISLNSNLGNSSLSYALGNSKIIQH
jgi:hypothetical protein